MSNTFDIGDRVRVVNNTVEPETNGATGTIDRPGVTSAWVIRLDQPTKPWGYTEAAVYENEIEPEPEPGVWLVYPHSSSDIGIPFATEIDALRHANTTSQRAKFVPFGTEFTLY